VIFLTAKREIHATLEEISKRYEEYLSIRAIACLASSL